MSIGIAYWIILLVWVVFGFWSGYNQPAGPPGSRWRSSGPNIVLLVLLILLGWAQFGQPLHR